MPTRFVGFWNSTSDGSSVSNDVYDLVEGFPSGAPWTRHRVEFTTGFLAVDVCGETTHEQSFSQADGGACGVGGTIRLSRRSRLVDRLGDERLRGAGDARLVLAAYTRWGAGAFAQIDGDFAFALWDLRRSSLFLVRDPFAVRRLHFAKRGDGVAFSSEVEGVLAWRPLGRQIDEVTVLDTLLGRYQTRTRTFFQSVKRVRPGHYFRFVAGGGEEHRYASPPPASFQLSTLRDYADAFQYEFTNEIAARLPRVGPVLCHLSGGLDSTTIAAVTAGLLERRGRRHDLRLATARFPGLPCDEGEVSHSLSNHLGIPLLEWNGTTPEVSDLDHARVAWPFGRSSMAGAVQGDVDIANRQGIVTILSGLGGNQLTDEWDYEADAFREGGALGLLAVLVANTWRLPTGKRLRYARRALSWTKDRFNPSRTHRRRIIHEDPILQGPPSWMQPSLLRAWSILEDETAYRGEAMPESGSWMREFVWNATTQDPRTVWTMEHEDARATERGVEFQYPFLSWTLLDLVMSMPWRMKVPRPYRRVLHREAMKGVLPESVRLRQDFVSFGEANLLNAQRAEAAIRSVLTAPQWACGHLVRRETVVDMLERWSGRKGETHTFAAREAWRFLRDVAALEAWMQRLSC